MAAAGLALRASYLWQFESSPLFRQAIGPDVGEYFAWAREIVAGCWLWPEVRIHSPLYPSLLAVLSGPFGLALPGIRLAQSLLILAAGIPLLAAMALAGRPSQHPLAKPQTLLLAGLLWALYPPLVYHGAELISEALLLPLLCLGLWLLYRAEAKPEAGIAPATGAGAAVGLAILAHPLSLLFFLAECLWLGFAAWRGPVAARRRGFAFALTAGLVVAPVAGYNLIHLHGPPLQSGSGFNFWLGNGPGADGTCRLRPGPEWTQAHRQGEAAARQLGLSQDRYFFQEGCATILAHPLAATRQLAAKALYAINFRELTAGADLAPLREFTPLLRWSRGAFALLAIAALALMLRRHGRTELLFAARHFLILGATCWAGQIVFVASGRYRLGMLPALVPLAALGWRQLTARQPAPQAATALALALAAAAVLLPCPPVHPDRERTEADSILAEAWLASGRPDRAEPLLRQAIAHQPQWSRHYNLLGLALRQLNRHDEAAATFRDAIAVAPDEPEARMNLATLHSDFGRTDEAEAEFALARTVAPPGPDLEFNLALFRQRQGRLDEAVAGYRATLATNPAHGPARVNLGTILMMQDAPHEAAAEFAIALRLAPHDPRIHINLALALATAGELRQARHELDQVLRQHPKLPAALELQRRLDQE